MSSGFETNNRKVHRVGCAHGIEILAEEHDLAACGTQEDHIILAIDPPSRFDDPLRLDFGDCAFRIGDGIDHKVEEAEIVHRSSEPRNVTDNLLSPR